jgi:hypothetical protein
MPFSAAAVVTPCVTYLITRLVLLCIALRQTLRGRPSPYEGDIMSTSPGWPPVVVSTLPFWFCLPAFLFLAVMAVVQPKVLGAAFQPVFVAAYLGSGAMWSFLFAFSFSSTEAWPRDSVVPGLILLLAGLIVAFVAIARVLRSAWQRSRSQPFENSRTGLAHARKPIR